MADGQAIDAMVKYGLQINTVPPETQKTWEALLQKTFAGLVGRTFDKTSLDLATQYVREYREVHAGK
jgi:hypothetical protein